MKKFLALFAFIFALFTVIISCNKTTLTTATTTTTNITTEETTVSHITTTNYEGPELLGLSVEPAIDPIDLPEPIAFSNKSRRQNYDILQSVFRLNSSIGEERITTRDASEYLVVHILQPNTGVLDEYIIDSITVRYPIPVIDDMGNELSEIKWTSDKIGEDGRKWYSNLSSTRYYIPIKVHTEEEINESGYTYEVIGIQFRSGVEMFDYTDPADISSIVLFVGNRPIISMDKSIDFVGFYNKLTREIRFKNSTVSFLENPDNADIVEFLINDMSVWVSSQQEDSFDTSVTFTIPENIVLWDYEWLNVTFKYKSGYGTIKEYHGYVNSGSAGGGTIRIYSGEELNSLDKTMRVKVELMNDITLPISFQPFVCERLEISSHGENIYSITATSSVAFVYYDNETTRNVFFEETYIIIAYINFFGDFVFENSSSLSEDEFVLALYNVNFSPDYNILGSIRIDSNNN